jgi:hypothetical protein
MAFSNLEIIFTGDFVAGEFLEFAYIQGASSTTIQYDCVASGATGRQFNEPTPTGTAGESTAIAYEAAFLALDVPLGIFTVSRVLNVVTITTTQISITYSTIIAAPLGKVTTVVNNTDFNETIFVRSPYFINTPTNGGTIGPLSSELKLKIWIGDKVADIPVDDTYTLTAEATNFGDNGIYFEVSELIRDFIDTKYNGTYVSYAAWVEYEVTTTYDAGVLSVTKTLLALDGYTDFKNGINYLGDLVLGFPDNAKLFSNDEIYIKKDDEINIPVLRNTTSEVGFYLGGVLQDSETITISDLTSETIAYSSYDLTSGDIDEIRITNSNTGTISSIDVIIVEECKYDVIKVTFKNKFGALYDVWMFKANKENLNVTKEKYRTNLLTSVAGSVQYNTASHQYENFLFKGNKKIQLNSGYLSEDNNTIFEQLLLSDRIWITKGDIICPVNIVTSGLDIKTRINDKLIAYTVDFEYSFDEMNNVR